MPEPGARGESETPRGGEDPLAARAAEARAAIGRRLLEVAERMEREQERAREAMRDLAARLAADHLAEAEERLAASLGERVAGQGAELLREVEDLVAAHEARIRMTLERRLAEIETRLVERARSGPEARDARAAREAVSRLDAAAAELERASATVARATAQAAAAEQRVLAAEERIASAERRIREIAEAAGRAASVEERILAAAHREEDAAKRLSEAEARILRIVGGE